MKRTNKRNVCLQILFHFFFFFFFLHKYLPVVAFTALDIALDCASQTNTTTQHRKWVADNNSTFLLFDRDIPSSTSKSLQQSRSGSVPYSDARFSTSKFTYVFPLTSGQKFIRLHFYPTSYTNNVDLALDAFFSVTAGRFTLLRNFSASLHAAYLGDDIVIREFCINVEQDQELSITFTPLPGAYAFINGIEIVSMPTNFYFTPAGDEGFKLVGGVNPFPITNDTALEMMYRVNVGGNAISPGDDTGMYRAWIQDVDYLTDARPSALPTNNTIILTFSANTQNYSAPRAVYTTARTMGLNKTINENYNLTWKFPVDSAFIYMVRMHFCEFQGEIQKEGDRVFEIFLADQTAETIADVIGWSGGSGFPVYKDYAVQIGARGTENKQNLTIALHPAPEGRTSRSDAILNGVEIFKLSNNGDLSAPNPDVQINTGTTNTPEPTTKPKNNRTTMFAVLGSVAAAFFILSLLGFFIFQRKRRTRYSYESTDGGSWWHGFSYATTINKSSKTRDGSSLPSDLCRHFSLPEIKAATNNFDDVFIIGVGGFGNVYKGLIDENATPVAIKRLNPESQQGAHEFKTEIEMLSLLRHMHLVSLIGYCNDDGEMILVYDYMSRGTLRDHLYNSDNPSLFWTQRLEICIGAARGLHYLHTGAKQTIIHRDVKTTNILLDEKWTAKVSDFGLSKVGPTNPSRTHVSTVVKGSLGYLDPEYYRRQQLTEKSDVYSFGVVLLETLSARPPIHRTAEKKQVSLAAWAQQCQRNGSLDQIVDPLLKRQISSECFKQFTEIAIRCLQDEGIKRPSMADILWGLEFALQLQKQAEKDVEYKFKEVDHEEIPIKDYVISSSMMEDSVDLFSSIGDHVLESRTDISISTTTSDDKSFFSK